jgi:ferredoxin
VAFDSLPVEERELWIAKWEIDRETCKSCGNPHDVCHDPERFWYPQRVVDYAVREQKAAQRQYDAIHEHDKAMFSNHDGSSWVDKPDERHPYGHDDGVTIIVTPVDHSPDDHFLTDARAPFYAKGGEDDRDQA